MAPSSAGRAARRSLALERGDVDDEGQRIAGVARIEWNCAQAIHGQRFECELVFQESPRQSLGG